MIPLDTTRSIEQHTADVYTAAVAFGGAKVVFASRYLCAMIGPHAHVTRWQKPIRKFIARAKWLRGQDGICTSRAIANYGCHVFSTLLFHCQFYPASRELLQAERRAIHITLASPFNAWPTHLVSCLDLGGVYPGMPSLLYNGRACMMRHAARSQSLHECQGLIDEVLASDDALLVPRLFREWYEKSIIRENIRAEEASRQCIQQIQLRQQGRNSNDLQRLFVKWLRNKDNSEELFVIACVKKFNTLCVTNVSRDGVRAFISTINLTKKYLPRRVILVAWRTIANAWCTAARFGIKRKCVFCGGDEGDNIKHFARCDIVRALLSRILRDSSNLDFVCAAPHFYLYALRDPAQLGRQAIILDVLFRIHTIARREATMWSLQQTYDAAVARLRDIALHSARTRALIAAEFCSSANS